MPKKTAMTSVLDGLKESIAARKDQLKTASAGSISTTQGTSEGSAPSPSSDAEVGEILPHGNAVPAEPKDNLISEKGVEVGKPVPGQPTPSEEQKERKETSPGTKLAATDFAGMRNHLAGVLKTAADNVAQFLEQKKTAAAKAASDGTPAPGSDDPATIPPIPTGGKDLSLGGGAKADTSTSAPKVEGVQGVTQTEVSGGKPNTDLEQGAQEQKVGGAIDLDALATKVAQATHHYGVGQALGYQLISLLNGGAAGGNDKTASANQPINEQVIQKIAFAGANDILSFAVGKGLITQVQAQSIQKEAGIAPHPLDVAIQAYQTKVASLMQAKKLTPETAAQFISKVAMHDKTANEMVGGDPAAAGAVQPEMEQIVAQVAQAVESGQMSEDQALQLLQELGIPVDQILAAQGGGAPGGDPAAGGAPMGADPMAAAAGAGAPPAADPMAGAGGGAPAGVDPAIAAAVGGAGGGAPPMSDPAAAAGAPAAAAEVAGAMGAGGGAPPPGAGAPPAAAGGPPAGGPPAGGPPSEGGGEKKPSEGGEKKSEGGEKKDDGKKSEGGEKKDEGKKDEGKKDEGKKSEGECKEAGKKNANDPAAMAAAADPAAAMAGGGDPAAAMAGGDPAAAAGGGGAPQDPQALLQQIVTDLEAAVQAGLMTQEQAQEVLAELTGGAGGGADPAAAGAAPAADPAAAAMAGGGDPAAAPAPAAPVA